MRNQKSRVKNSSAKKSKKRRVVTSVTKFKEARVLSPFRLKKMQEWAFWISNQTGWSYRKLASKTRRKFGWWQHIGAGHFNLRVYRKDYDRLKDIFDLLQVNAHLDRREFDLMLEIIDHRSKLDAALSKLTALIQRNGAINSSEAE